MSNFDELKEKARETIENIVDFSQETCKKAESKAKTLARRAKLTTNITRERTIIRRNHIEIGTKYYDQHKNKPAKALEENCIAITEALNRIAEMEQELKDLAGI